MVKAGLDEEKITYIPNFVSKEQFYKKTDKEIKDLKKKYNIEDKFTVLGAGQVQTRKGVLDFVKVAEMLPDVNFVWAGGFSFGAITDGHKELQRVMDNPPKNVKFLGIIPRDEMNDLFNACDLLFVPSYNELFPMTILEAMSTDTPLLLRDLELYEDILFNKYNKAHDNDGFASKINELKNNKTEYNKAVKLAKEVSKFYSEENVYKMWKDYYTSLVNEKTN